jgi:hypothetical protein
MVNIGGRHSELCRGKQGRWPRSEEARFPNHKDIVVEWAALKDQSAMHGSNAMHRICVSF